MKKHSVQKGFAILSVSGIIIKIISLLYIPLLLSIIGEKGNGFYQAAAQIFVFAYVLTNSGTLNAITKMTSEYVARGEHQDGVASGRLMANIDAQKAFKVSRLALAAIGGIITLLLIILSQPIANAVRFPEISLSIIVIAPSAFLTAIVSSYRGYYQGMNNFRPRAVSQVLEQSVNLVASIGLALLGVAIFGFGRDGILMAVAGANAGTTVAALASLVYLVRFSKKHEKEIAVQTTCLPGEEPVRKAFSISRKTWDATPESVAHSEKEFRKKALATFFRYSIPITMAAGLQYAGSIVDMWNTKSRLLVAGFSPDVATEMFGYLAKYQQLIYVPLIIIIGLASTILPNLSGFHAIDDTSKFKSSLSYAYRWCFIIAIPSTILMAVLSSQIFSTIHLGKGSELLMIGSVVTVLMAVSQIQSSVLQGLSKMYLLAGFLLAGIAAKILVNYVLIAIPFINVNGAIIGSIVCYMIPVYLNNRYIRAQLRKKFRITGEKPPKIMPFVYKPFSSAMIMGFVVAIVYAIFYALTSAIFGKTGSGGYFAVLIPFIISVIAGGVTFLGAMVAFKGFKKIDLEMIPHRLKKFIPKRVLDGLK